MINLCYWAGQKNVGDYYAYWLATKLYKNVICNKPRPNLIITGSILGFKCLSNDTIVWGSGWHNTEYSKTCNITSKQNFKAVRGKLTANFLNLDNAVVLGDPGILASRYFTPELHKRTKILILCHWLDYEKINSVYGKKFKVINMQTNDVEGILTEIYNADLVLSSSLHGIIFAHSYGVPAIHIIANTPESKDCFKFKDYYSAFNNIKYISYKLNYKTDVKVFEEFYSHKNEYRIGQDEILRIQDNLLAVKPDESIFKYKNSCLCAIAKNENNYLREWVEYHKNLGFDKIYLYDNNDLAGEHFEEVINDYIQDGYVSVLNIRGKSNQQIKCYDEFYHSYAKNYNWVAFFDIDEFLHIDNNLTINEMLEQPKYNEFQAIAVNWKYFDDNDLVQVENNNYSVTRFTHEHQEKDWAWAQFRFSKRIVRTNIPKVKINSSHGPIKMAVMSEYGKTLSNTLNVCNIAGKRIDNTIAFNMWTYSGGYLAHYRYKTIEEYITNKMKRGYPTLFKNSGKDMNLEDFFALNTKTAEKLALANKLLKDKNSEINIAEHAKYIAPTKNNKTKTKADGQSNAYLYF